MTAILGAWGIQDKVFYARSSAALDNMNDRGGHLRRNWTAGNFCVAIAHPGAGSQEGFYTQGSEGVSVAYDGCVYGANGRRLDAVFDPVAVCRQLVASYLLRGPNLFATLEGSFAVVLLDETRRRIYLVKDAFGTKPMFYIKHGGAIAFSSEISGLLALSGSDCSPDLHSLDTYLSLGYVMAPRTMFKKIRQLTPGHYLEIGEDGVIAEQCHHQAPQEVFSVDNLENWASTLRNVLIEAVGKRFVSHPHASILLSGGVDTAAVAGAAAQLSIPLRTFTMGFPDCPALDESRLARWLAQKVGAQHTEIAVDENCIVHLDAIVRHVGSPVANPAALIANALFSQLGNHVDAVMCGDGGNEIFGGTYKYHQLMHYVTSDGRRPWRSLMKSLGQKVWRRVEDTRLDEWFQRLARRYFESIGQRAVPAVTRQNDQRFEAAARYYAALNSIWTDRTKQCLYSDDLKVELAATDSTGPLVGLFYQEADNLMQNVSYVRTTSFIPYEVMPCVEFSAVANGVTPLFPLLDEHLADLMFRIPYELVFGRGYRHFMEQALCGSLVPVEVFRRAHKGFKPPLNAWLRTPLWRGMVEDFLSEESIKERGLFSPVFVRDVIRKYYAGQRYLVTEYRGRVQPLADSLWSLMALEAWLRQLG